MSQSWIRVRLEEVSVTALCLFHGLICNCKCSLRRSEEVLSDLSELVSFCCVCLLVSNWNKQFRNSKRNVTLAWFWLLLLYLFWTNTILWIVFPVSDHNNLISSQIMSVISMWHSSTSGVMFIYLHKKFVMAGDEKIWD